MIHHVVEVVNLLLIYFHVNLQFLSGPGQPTRGCLPSWELGGELTTPHRKIRASYESYRGPRN
jgi:hypothetical protein